MRNVMRRIFVFTLSACAVAYIVYVLAGASMYAQAEERARTVWVRDEISPNAHHMAGMITVQSSCTELMEKTEQLSPYLYKLVFTTWEHPNVECTDHPVQKEFYEIIFAPAVGVSFIATIDGQPLPIVVIPYVP